MGKRPSLWGPIILTHGVIGNTIDFGSIILGSSPSESTKIFVYTPRGERSYEL